MASHHPCAIKVVLTYRLGRGYCMCLTDLNLASQIVWLKGINTLSQTTAQQIRKRVEPRITAWIYLTRWVWIYNVSWLVSPCRRPGWLLPWSCEQVLFATAFILPSISSAKCQRTCPRHPQGQGGWSPCRSLEGRWWPCTPWGLGERARGREYKGWSIELARTKCPLHDLFGGLC